MGLESLRLYNEGPLPGAHGGVLGELIGNLSFAAFGFTGATLLLLLLIAVGISLYFHLSWWQIAENTGSLLENAFEFVRKIHR